MQPSPARQPAQPARRIQRDDRFFRLWIKMKSTTTKSTAATARIIVTLSTGALLAYQEFDYRNYFEISASFCTIVIIAGPKSTMNRLGKIKKTIGGIILIVVFAAISSACCLRRTRSASA